jgi:hypothetical protein
MLTGIRKKIFFPGYSSAPSGPISGRAVSDILGASLVCPALIEHLKEVQGCLAKVHPRRGTVIRPYRLLRISRFRDDAPRPHECSTRPRQQRREITEWKSGRLDRIGCGKRLRNDSKRYRRSCCSKNREADMLLMSSQHPQRRRPLAARNLNQIITLLYV